MSEDPKDNEDALYRVDTVPPPAGEDDAYNAPTRIGELPDNVLQSMRAAALPASFQERAPAIRPASGRPEAPGSARPQAPPPVPAVQPAASPPPAGASLREATPTRPPAPLLQQLDSGIMSAAGLSRWVPAFAVGGVVLLAAVLYAVC